MILNVLLADTDATTCDSLSRHIQALGHRVILADTEEAVTAAVAEQTCDLLLLDTCLPTMRDWTLLAQLRDMMTQTHDWRPIIVLCTDDAPDMIAEGLEAGAEEFLLKPVNPRLLAAKLNIYQRALRVYRDLQDSVAYMRAISDNLLDALITIDERGQILTANRATETLFGYRRDELIGRNINCLMPEPYHSEHDAYIARYLTTGRAQIIGQNGREVQGITRDGRVLDLRLGVSEVRLQQQRVFVGLLSDISELKRKEVQIKEDADQLWLLNQRMKMDMAMATHVMDHLILKEALQDPQIRYHLRPAAQFNGDVLAIRRSAKGVLYFMLADATGHGLAAAISLLPALWVFYGMAVKDASVSEIAAEINLRLKQLIPIGRFVAAHIGSVNTFAQTLRLWSGGMPPAYLIDDTTGDVSALPSRHPALGILSNHEFNPDCELIEWQRAQLLLYSDGLIEAQNERGDMWGEHALREVLQHATHHQILEHVLWGLDRHIAGHPVVDDISIVDVLLQR